ncbi:hypothetical protein [Dactylosporangium sp. CS-033363]
MDALPSSPAARPGGVPNSVGSLPSSIEAPATGVPCYEPVPTFEVS